MPLGVRRNQKETTEERAIEISAGMQGNLNFSDFVNLKIDGEFKGSLTLKGNLTIGTNGHVEANIKADNIVVAGKIKGDVFANTMLVLMPTATIHGSIKTPKLNIVEGAIFQGHCQMMENNNIEENLLDIQEVASYLEIEAREIERLAVAGKIPGIKKNNSWKFERSKIDSWATSGKVSNNL